LVTLGDTFSATFQWVAGMVIINRRPPSRETNPLAIFNDFDGIV
jgi:hypothetical protein